MDRNLHNIEDLFRKGLDDHTEMPPARSWKDIDNTLNKQNIARIEKKYKYLKGVALLLLLLLGLAIYELSTRRNSQTESTAAIKSQNLIDAKKQSKEIAPVDDKVANKNTSNDGVQLQPGNERDITTSAKTLLDLKKNGHYNQNNSSPVENSSPVLRNKRQFNDKTLTKIKVTSPNPIEDDLKMATNKDVTRSAIYPKKSLQPVAVDEAVSLPDTNSPLASNTKKKVRKSTRFAINPFFSPDLAWYRLRVDKANNNQPDNASKIEKGEHHEFSSTTGLLVEYPLSKGFTLQTGLLFSNINIIINPKTIYAERDNTGNVKYRLNISSGYGYLVPSFQNTPAVGDSLYISGATHKLRYIGIPIAVKYRFVKGKLSIEAIAGVGVNVLARGKLETEIQQGINNEIDVLNKIQGLKSVYFNGLAGISTTYKLSDKFSFTLMPQARIALTSINKNAVLKTYPNSVGLSAGLKIKL